MFTKTSQFFFFCSDIHISTTDPLSCPILLIFTLILFPHLIPALKEVCYLWLSLPNTCMHFHCLSSVLHVPPHPTLLDLTTTTTSIQDCKFWSPSLWDFLNIPETFSYFWYSYALNHRQIIQLNFLRTKSATWVPNTTPFLTKERLHNQRLRNLLMLSESVFEALVC